MCWCRAGYHKAINGFTIGFCRTCPTGQKSSNSISLTLRFSYLIRVESSSSLGGVWKYRQAADEISIDDLGDDDTDFTDESALGTPLPDTEMSFFDPLHPVSTGTGQGGGAVGVDDDSWLLSALSACAELNKEDQSSSATSVDEDGRGTPRLDSRLEPLRQVEPDGAGIGMGHDNQYDNGGSNPALPGNIDEQNEQGIPDDISSNFSESSSVWDEFDPLGKSRSSKVEIGKGDLTFNLVDKALSSHSLGKPEVGKGDLTFDLMGCNASRQPPDGQDSSVLDVNTEPSRHDTPSFQTDSGTSFFDTKKSTAKSSPLRFWSSSPKDSPQHKSTTSSVKSSPAKSPRRQLMTVDLGERGTLKLYTCIHERYCKDKKQRFIQILYHLYENVLLDFC